MHGLFVPGPTNVPETVRKAIDIPMEDHRAPDLPAFTLPLFADLKQIFKTETGQIFLFPSSGTGGWEAAITNTLSPGDRVCMLSPNSHFYLESFYATAQVGLGPVGVAAATSMPSGVVSRAGSSPSRSASRCSS